MASKFLRRQKWWIKFRHPQSGEVIRESLQTHDPSRADLLLARVEAQLQLLEPRIQHVVLPESISKLLQVVPADNAVPALSIMLAPALQTPATVPIKADQERTTVNHAMAAYLRFIRSENASAYVRLRLHPPGGKVRGDHGVMVGVANKTGHSGTFKRCAHHQWRAWY